MLDLAGRPDGAAPEGPCEPQLYERAALRWLARFISERRDVTLTAVAKAADALALLRLDPEAARAELAHLLGA